MTDKKNTVTILGEEVDIQFNMAVEIAYEEITDEPFSIESLNKQKNSLALYMAAIITSKQDTAITIERLMKEATGQEIGMLAVAVIDAMTEWMKTPEVLKGDDTEKPSGKDEEGKEKN